MTDRMKGCVVAFDDDIREDDVQPLLSAIGQLRGVLSVAAVRTDMDDYMNRARVRAELTERLFDVLREAKHGS